MGYANKNNIILKLYKKNKNGNYPLLYNIDKNNNVIFKLLIEIE